MNVKYLLFSFFKRFCYYRISEVPENVRLMTDTEIERQTEIGLEIVDNEDQEI